jgi:hypothetical protein
LEKLGFPRNALLAELLYIKAILSSRLSASRNSDELLQACKRYFAASVSKPCCYDDIRDYLDELGLDARNSFLSHVDEVCRQLQSRADKGKVWRFPLLRTFQFYQQTPSSNTAAPGTSPP